MVTLRITKIKAQFSWGDLSLGATLKTKIIFLLKNPSCDQNIKSNQALKMTFKSGSIVR
jgi:hypothetical protein